MTVDVIQASAWFPPEQIGGTEIYLQGLAGEAKRLGFESQIAVPRPAAQSRPYQVGGLNVIPYPDRESVGGPAQLKALADQLEAAPRAIYHQHSWTPDCGAEHLALAKRMGRRTVLTVHVPSVSCLRGTMMLMGEKACDGRIEVVRCGECWARGRGAPRALAALLTAAPATLARMAEGSRLGTAMGARDLVRARLREMAEAFANADRIVAVCQWLFDALALNGAPAEKLVLSRQGVSEEFTSLAPGPPLVARRLLFLGRWHPVKGVDLVVRALKAAPDLDVTLTIVGLPQGEEERAYTETVNGLAQGDQRIVFADPVGRADLTSLMAAHDALVVPSTWLETGPLVVLEALAAGLPVIGSDLGGIAELIDTPDKGCLVTTGDVTAWTRALRAFRAQPPRPRPHWAVRTMADAAADMAALYRDIAA